MPSSTMRSPQSATSGKSIAFQFPSTAPNGAASTSAGPSNGHILPSYGRTPAESSAREISPSGHRKFHSRTNSIKEVFNNVRRRSGSTAEIVENLKAPISYKLVSMCLIWYVSSGVTNTSSKTILNAFKQPVTLVIVQFAFVTGWCLLLSLVGHYAPGKIVPGIKGGLKYPTKEIIRTTAPLALFQVGGHITSSFATSRIPVSLVHTIKGLSPLFTVFAYRTFQGVNYSKDVYVSLIPLTIGVMLACSGEFRGNFLGIISAFIGAIIFVTQNIVSKKIFNNSAKSGLERTTGPKLDKLNLLAYSSGMAFLLSLPLWLSSEGFTLIGEYFSTSTLQLNPKSKLSGWGLIYEFIFNGTSHFGQNIIAFSLLSMVEPVTYSVASLIKRIFVIVMAIVWFGNMPTRVQGLGILLTFLGLWLYDKAKDLDRKEKAKIDPQPLLLPLSNNDAKYRSSPLPPLGTSNLPTTSVYANTASSAVDTPAAGAGVYHPRRGSVSLGVSPMSGAPPSGSGINGVLTNGEKKLPNGVGLGHISEDDGSSRRAIPLAPGTRQESTWRGAEVWGNGGLKGGGIVA